MSGIKIADLFGPLMKYPTVSEYSSLCGTSMGFTIRSFSTTISLSLIIESILMLLSETN